MATTSQNPAADQAPIPTSGQIEMEAPSPRQIMLRRSKSHYGLIIGGTVVLIAFICAIFATPIAPFDPFDQDLSNRLVNPIWGKGGNWTHPLGTDALGRDYLSRVIHGTQISLMIGFFAAGMASIVGTTLGLIGG